MQFWPFANQIGNSLAKYLNFCSHFWADNSKLWLTTKTFMLVVGWITNILNLISSPVYKHLLQRLWNCRRELAPFFVIAKKLMMGTARTGDKSYIRNKKLFNSTMMASLLVGMLQKK